MSLGKMVNKQEFSKYERARIIGARGLQISMDAPLLVSMNDEELNGVNYDPLRIAERELNSGVLPISVNRPMPKRREESLEKIKVEDTKVSDVQKEQMERQEEKDIAENGEMMGFANSSEEQENTSSNIEERKEVEVE